MFNNFVIILQLIDKPLPTKIEISDCPENDCKFYRGSEYTLKLTCSNNRALESLFFNVDMDVFGYSVHFPGYYDAEACKYLTDSSGGKLGCSIQSKQPFTFTFTYLYDEEYPVFNFPIHVVVALRSEGNIICCAIFTARLYKPINKP